MKNFPEQKIKQTIGNDILYTEIPNRKKRHWTLILPTLAFLLLILFAVTFYLYQTGWFHELVPSYETSNFTTGHTAGDPHKLVSSAGTPILHDDEWILCHVGYIDEFPGDIELSYNVTASIRQGKIKFIVLDMGKTIPTSAPDYSSEEFPVVYEEEIPESGTFHFDLPMLKKGEVYMYTLMETLSDDTDYYAEVSSEAMVPRWMQISNRIDDQLSFFRN